MSKTFVIITTLFIATLISCALPTAVSSSPLLKLKDWTRKGDQNKNNLTVNGCWDCKYSPNGVCCVGGERCPNGKPCCGKKGESSPVACETSCDPQCPTNVAKPCGNGGCPMLPSTTCGTCDANTEMCNVSSGSCVKAPVCYLCFSGHCCVNGEMCPSETGSSLPSPCCASTPGQIVDCYHNCTPSCSGRVCGAGGCPNFRSNTTCGSCDEGDVCTDAGQCVCPVGCDCGKGKHCKSCPPESQGCSTAQSGPLECSCLGPKKPQSIPPKTLVLEAAIEGIGCGDSHDCGGYRPILPSTPTPYSIYYEGSRGGSEAQLLIAVFEAPNNEPFPGKNIFVKFGKNSTVENCCSFSPKNSLPSLNYPPFQVSLSNCQQTVYPPCYNDNNNSCFNKENPKNCQTLSTKTTNGNGRGLWFENPGTNVVTVTISVSDYYYFCGCDNYANAFVQRDGISIEYNDVESN